MRLLKMRSGKSRNEILGVVPRISLREIREKVIKFMLSFREKVGVIPRISLRENIREKVGFLTENFTQGKETSAYIYIYNFFPFPHRQVRIKKSLRLSWRNDDFFTFTLD
jgi:hypothetical protein